MVGDSHETYAMAGHQTLITGYFNGTRCVIVNQDRIFSGDYVVIALMEAGYHEVRVYEHVRKHATQEPDGDTLASTDAYDGDSTHLDGEHISVKDD